MGHKEAIVLILIFPHVIILILEEKEEKSSHTHKQNTDVRVQGRSGLT